ncbi:MAG: hypothetical protein JNK78_11040 [Planctomycetes bacterium]|nr:hypothetical protein [Planctomycetota bacterium]
MPSPALRPFPSRLPIACLAAALAACGASTPPAAAVEPVIAKEVSTFDSGNWGNLGLAPTGIEVVDVELGEWAESEMSVMQRKNVERGGGDASKVPVAWETKWTATLRLKEPVVMIDHELRGRFVVRTIAETGATLPFAGRVRGALLPTSGWDVMAHVDRGNSQDGGPLRPWFDAAGEVRNGYPVIGDPNREVRMRSGPRFVSASLLPGAIVLGSEDHAKLAAEQKKADEARAAEWARETERRRQQQVAEQQAAEAAAKKRADDAAKARAERAEAQRRATAAPRLAPFVAAATSGRGAMLALPASAQRGFVFTEVQHDAATLKTVGKGIDIRTLPARDVAFEAVVDAQGNVALTIDGEAKPVQLGNTVGDAVVCSGNMQLAALTEERARALTAIAAAARRERERAAASLEPAILDAAAVAARANDGAPVALSGEVLQADRPTPQLAAMFAPGTDAKQEFRVNNRPTVLRLAAPTRGAALLLRAGSRGTAAMTVLLNGTLTVEIPATAKDAGCVVALPPDLEVIDVRLEAKGDTRLRGLHLLSR